MSFCHTLQSFQHVNTVPTRTALRISDATQTNKVITTRDVIHLDENTEHLPSSCTCTSAKMSNIGQKTLSTELASLATPSHFVQRGLLGSGIVEGSQVAQRLGQLTLSRILGLAMVMVLRVPRVVQVHAATVFWSEKHRFVY